MPGRDRDPQGRARNARPRDATGRPLPRAAAGAEQLPDDLDLTPAGSIARAQRLLDEGLPFPAHEVLEAAWKAAPDEQRELWRGLAQLAVGLTHLQRGNARGAVALLSRAAERIGTWIGPPPHDLDLDGLAAHAVDLAHHIERDGVEAVGQAEQRLRLRGRSP
ncbi:MAG: DUF309 domain-containing protein [Pseudonocardia sp.]